MNMKSSSWAKKASELCKCSRATVHHYAFVHGAPRHPACFWVWFSFLKADKKRNYLNRKKQQREQFISWAKDHAVKVFKEKGDEYKKRLEAKKRWIKTSEGNAWRLAYYERIKEKRRIYQTTKYRTNPQFKIGMLLRRGLSRMVERFKVGKLAQTRDYLGCTAAELKAHIESQFETGMSWENHGRWHIDHIKPLAAFDLTSREQQLQCWHFTNLRPLWGDENLSKGSKWTP